MIIKIRTKNDVNGNSRRAWVAFDPSTSAPIAWYDEGHRGYEAVPEALRIHVAAALDVVVTPSEFRNLRATVELRKGA